MERRLPNGGCLVKAYAYGHLLHPVYRGMLLSDYNLRDATLEQFVADNETVEEETVMPDDLNEAVVDYDSDDEYAWLDQKHAKHTQSQGQNPTQQSQSLLTPQTPLQAEVARYMSNRDVADRPSAGTPTFDVLGWWSVHDKIFPLLSKAAKKYLAIQATSCASERTFSTGGATVSNKRTKLDPTNVHYLVYCKENMDKVKLVRPRVEDDEEKDLEEQFENE